MQTDLVSTKEAATMIGITVSTANRWAASGRLPIASTTPFGRLYRRSTVERVAADHKAATLARLGVAS